MQVLWDLLIGLIGLGIGGAVVGRLVIRSKSEGQDDLVLVELNALNEEIPGTSQKNLRDILRVAHELALKAVRTRIKAMATRRAVAFARKVEETEREINDIMGGTEQQQPPVSPPPPDQRGLGAAITAGVNAGATPAPAAVDPAILTAQTRGWTDGWNDVSRQPTGSTDEIAAYTGAYNAAKKTHTLTVRAGVSPTGGGGGQPQNRDTQGSTSQTVVSSGAAAAATAAGASTQGAGS